ncbi:hypothetical protein [Mycolicibacterium sp. NCC-Tsukiji]|uniref:hypothetical protein n=1 Tax=Mycolicibacterium sp. NCC-Tsukiji TaxID=2185272 RepID=UPI00278BD9D0|nr:hypothetical protein [Mycolicibacterium sp. NCC-Tsukiji]
MSSTVDDAMHAIASNISRAPAPVLPMRAWTSSASVPGNGISTAAARTSIVRANSSA